MSVHQHMDNPGETYRRLLRHSAKYWRLIVVSMMGYALYAATHPAIAEMMKVIAETIANPTPGMVLVICVAPLAITLTQGVGMFLGAYFIANAGQSLVQEMRNMVFGHVLRLPVREYQQRSSGHIMSKVTYDAQQVTAAGTDALTILFREGLTVVGLLVYLLYKNWQLTLLLLTVGPAMGLVINHMSKRFRKLARRKQRSMGNITQFIGEAIDGHQPVKIFSGQARESARFETASAEFRKQNLRLTVGKVSSTVLVQIIIAIGVGVITYLYIQVMGEGITVGDFLAFVGAVGLLQKPLKALTAVNVKIQKGITGAASLFELLDRPSEPDQGVRTLERSAGDLEFRHVRFGYQPDVPVLHDLSFHARPGEVVALVGRSGAGKSTIASLVPRFYDVEAGEILIDGVPIMEYRLDDLRRQISMVTQKVVLFNGTIRDNIAYGELADSDEDAVIRAARDAYAWDFIQHLPKGLDTPVGQDGVQLSGGQRQRVAIARALLKDAPLLILDEATSALDNESEHFIHQALEKVMQGRTTLVIAHRLSTIEKANRILVLEQGRLVEQGTHQELLDRNGLYTQMYRMNFEE